MSGEPDPIPPPTSLEAWLDARLREAPGWSVSLAFHAVVLALLATISLGSGGGGLPGDEGLWISLAPKASPTRLEVLDRPRALVARDADTAAEVPLFLDSAEEGLDALAAPELPGVEEAERLVSQAALPEPTEAPFVPDARPASVAGARPRARIAAPAASQRAAQASGVGGDDGRAGGAAARTRRRNLIARCGCGPASESSVTAGLRWLARHQGADGGWSCAGFGAQCASGPCAGGGDPRHDVGTSGLATLAFLGAGYTHLTRTTYTDAYSKAKMSFGKVVKRGLDWLIARQAADGCVGPKHEHHLYDHAIAALTLAEAYGLTNAAVYEAPAQRAIDYLVAAQNPGLAWRYTPRCGDNDTSVTGWAVMALKSAKISGLAVPPASFDGARAWLDRVTDSAGLVGYTAVGTIDVVVPGKNEAWRARPTMTAVGLLSRIYLDGDPKDRRLLQAARLVANDPPGWDEEGHEIDSYYWYYGALALFQFRPEPEGDELWRLWNEPMKLALVPNQKLRKHGCQDGSWDPAVDRWGFAGGRVVVTALNTMSLEVYYRYESVFGE